MELHDFPWNKEECWLWLEGSLRDCHPVWCQVETMGIARVAFDDLWINELETRHATAALMHELILKILMKASGEILMRELQLRELRQRWEEQMKR